MSMPGDIFVHRNIAKYALTLPARAARHPLLTLTCLHSQFHLDDDNALSVLTFAVAALGVSHIIVAGHTGCGGVQAAHDTAHPPPSGFEPPAEPLPRWLAPLTEIARAPEYEQDLQALTEANVRAQVANVVKTDVVRAAWAEGQELQVHGWIYELDLGRFQDMGISVDGLCEENVV